MSVTARLFCRSIVIILPLLDFGMYVLPLICRDIESGIQKQNVYMYILNPGHTFQPVLDQLKFSLSLAACHAPFG